MRQDRGQSSPPDSAPRRSGPAGRLPPYIQASRACLSCPSSTPFTEPDRLTLIGPRKRVRPIIEKRRDLSALLVRDPVDPKVQVLAVELEKLLQELLKRLV